MLSEAEFAREQEKLGLRIHQNGGVWWEQVNRMYCKPAFEFQVLRPGTARPHLRHALLGYSHQVPEASLGNRTVRFMILEGDDLRGFDIPRLSVKKRNQVRKGLDQCEVRPLDEIESHLEQMRLINMSQAARQDRVDVPPEYYEQKAEAWRRQIRLYFSHAGYRWSGAFRDGTLIAYLSTLSVAGVTFVQVVKSHTDHLISCPVDALYYKALLGASRDPGCQMVVNGGPANRGLDHFKEQFLFRPRPFSYYTANEPVYVAARWAGTRSKELALAVKKWWRRSPAD